MKTAFSTAITDQSLHPAAMIRDQIKLRQGAGWKSHNPVRHFVAGAVFVSNLCTPEYLESKLKDSSLSSDQQTTFEISHRSHLERSQSAFFHHRNDLDQAPCTGTHLRGPQRRCDSSSSRSQRAEPSSSVNVSMQHPPRSKVGWTRELQERRIYGQVGKRRNLDGSGKWSIMGTKLLREYPTKNGA
jgi:hypothetical protein